MKLTRWDNQETIFEYECDLITELIQKAVEEKISLYRANLRGANLRGANLRGANLRGANLGDTIGNLREVKNIIIETYIITFTKEVLQIGCKRHSIKKWREFKDSDIKKLDDGALVFWKKWREFIFMAIDLSFEKEGQV